jgi:hypothetical protein
VGFFLADWRLPRWFGYFGGLQVFDLLLKFVHTTSSAGSHDDRDDGHDENPKDEEDEEWFHSAPILPVPRLRCKSILRKPPSTKVMAVLVHTAASFCEGRTIFACRFAVLRLKSACARHF